MQEKSGDSVQFNTIKKPMFYINTGLLVLPRVVESVSRLIRLPTGPCRQSADGWPRPL